MALNPGDTRVVKIMEHDEYGNGIAPYGELDIVVPNIDTYHHTVGSVVEVAIQDYSGELESWNYNPETTLLGSREENVDLTGGAEMPRRQRRINKYHIRNKRRSTDDPSEQARLWAEEMQLSTDDELRRYTKRIKEKAIRKIENSKKIDDDLENPHQKSIQELQEFLSKQDSNWTIVHELKERLDISNEEFESRKMNGILRRLSKF